MISATVEENSGTDRLAGMLRRYIQPAEGAVFHASLFDLIGDARFALLGEASHGTHEFYRERVEITKLLILERGFNAVVAEADWPDAYRVNRYVRGRLADTDAETALSDFERFPAWMWRNRVVRDFVEWLREHNRSQPPERQVGFYGMDLYSLFTSTAAVLAYLGRVDPDAAKRARERYACFDHFEENTQSYGYAAAFSLGRSCENAVVAQLIDLQRHAAEYSRLAGDGDPDAFFHAEQNAELVKNAEEYYRTMFRGRVSSWNLRDRHMMQTVRALAAHLGRPGWPSPRMALWAHNSHLGDARATEMGRTHGEWNVGQLLRERYGNAVVTIGFTTYRGTVTAASDWDSPAKRMTVRPGLEHSCEALFHALGTDRFLLRLDGENPPAELLARPLLQRAIGVIYRPESERRSHYFHGALARQFDAVIHIDETSALVPLEPGAQWTGGEAPETYPSGL